MEVTPAPFYLYICKFNTKHFLLRGEWPLRPRDFEATALQFKSLKMGFIFRNAI